MRNVDFVVDLTNTYMGDNKIPYKISKFPDGQQTVDLDSVFIENTHLMGKSVMIISRLNNFLDLELIVCTNQALRNLYVGVIDLYVPYFLGSRSDRKFVLGGSNYLKQVITPIINAQQFRQVTVLDAHSEILEALIKDYSLIKNDDFIDWVLKDLFSEGKKLSDIIFVSPDAGASKKIFRLAETFNINKVVTGSKLRDKEVRDVYLPIDMNDVNKTFVIIDDIGDGFGTFLQLANKFKTLNQEVDWDINLAVTHTIQYSGLQKVLPHYKRVYTTNSYANWESENNFKCLDIFNNFL